MGETETPSISHSVAVIGGRSIWYLVLTVFISFVAMITITALGSLALIVTYITRGISLHFLFAIYTIIGLGIYVSQVVITGKVDYPEEAGEFNLDVILLSSIAFYSFMIIFGVLFAMIALTYTTAQLAFAVAILYGPFDMELSNHFGVSPASLLAVMAVAGGLLAGVLTETAYEIDPRDVPRFTWNQFRKGRFGRFNI